MRLDGESFGDRKSVRGRDVNLVAVGGFGLGKLEGVDSLARRRRDVRIIVRRGKKRGFEGVGARASSSRLSIMGGAHRGDERRVVEKVLIEVDIFIKDRGIDERGRSSLPRYGGGSLFNESGRSRVMDRNRAGRQVYESKVGLTKAVAIMEITDTKGRARLAQSDHSDLDKRVTAPGAHLLNSKESIAKLINTGFPLDAVRLVNSMFTKGDNTSCAPQESRNALRGEVDSDIPGRGDSRGRGGGDGLGASTSKITRARSDRGDPSWQAGFPPLTRGG